MKIKINGNLVMDGDSVTVTDTVDLTKVNTVYRVAKSILDRFPDIVLVEIERPVEPEEP